MRLEGPGGRIMFAPDPDSSLANDDLVSSLFVCVCESVRGSSRGCASSVELTQPLTPSFPFCLASFPHSVHPEPFPVRRLACKRCTPCPECHPSSRPRTTTRRTRRRNRVGSPLGRRSRPTPPCSSRADQRRAAASSRSKNESPSKKSPRRSRRTPRSSTMTDGTRRAPGQRRGDTHHPAHPRPQPRPRGRVATFRRFWTARRSGTSSEICGASVSWSGRRRPRTDPSSTTSPTRPCRRRREAGFGSEREGREG